MTAAEAIASIREDIAALEAKNLPSLRPGFFRRRRAEVDAIDAELATQAATIERLKEECSAMLEQQCETDLRLGMLANVLSILGFDPMVHLRRPLADEPDVYHDAAALVYEHRRAAGLSNRTQNHRTVGDLRDILINALWTARLERRLTSLNHQLAKYRIHAPQQEKEPA